MKTISINDNFYQVITLLGKGKGGYSYLVIDDLENKYVIKQIHHEPCSYYTFSNKLESELKDYEKLKNLNINIPLLIDVDYKNERILKEYIEGDTIDIYVKNDCMKESYFQQIRKLCSILYKNNLNIDYFPTNFVIKNNILYYIDYECNVYMDEWNFENWGIKYWSKTNEFISHFIKEEK